MIQKIASAALRMPLMVFAAAALIIVVGLLAYKELDIEAYPNPVPPLVEIITQPPGWSAEETERYVTVPLEIGLSGMPGLEHVRSQSLFALSDVECYFDWKTEYADAKQEVINRIQFVQLPTGYRRRCRHGTRSAKFFDIGSSARVTRSRISRRPRIGSSSASSRPSKASSTSRATAARPSSITSKSTPMDPIRAVQAKGYSLTAIAKVVSDSGIPITPGALRLYASGGKTAAGAKRKTKAKSTDKQPAEARPGTPASTPNGARTQPAVPAAKPAGDSRGVDLDWEPAARSAKAAPWRGCSNFTSLSTSPPAVAMAATNFVFATSIATMQPTVTSGRSASTSSCSTSTAA
jgi:hypothetical protein